MSQDRRQLGSSAYVPGVREGRLLRFLQEPPCHRALPLRRPPDHAIHRTWGRLAMVLHRRDLPQLTTSSSSARNSATSALSLMRMRATLATISEVPKSIRAVT